VAGSRRQPNDDAIRSSEVPQKASEIAALPNPYGRGEAQLNGERLHRNNAWQMVRRRAQAAGITTEVCNHTFRGTGITAYLENSGTLEKARQMAAHASTRTTQLYDRREDRVTLDEVVKINIRG
jgi:integrase